MKYLWFVALLMLNAVAAAQECPQTQSTVTVYHYYVMVEAAKIGEECIGRPCVKGSRCELETIGKQWGMYLCVLDTAKVH
jgi:hypothetical protein